MGPQLSKEEKQEKEILRLPTIGEASDLYWASRGGDVDAVRQILTTTSFNDLNHLEPNGSTALHAASFFGHTEIVRLLLQERGVMRHRKNRHGLTTNDEIRQLFHRPNSNHFCNDSADDDGSIFNFTTDLPIEDDDKLSDDWVEGYADELQVKAIKTAMLLGKVIASSWILQPLRKKIVDGMDDRSMHELTISDLQKFVDAFVTTVDPQYDEICELLSKYKKTKKPEHLLRIYSLETPFYRSLAKEDNMKYLLDPLMSQLSAMKSRAFSGRSYRGLSMTKTDFRTYRWALKKKGSIIWIKTFCSSSVDEVVARGFKPDPYGENVSVLMVFNFPQPCDMAIQLYALSKTLPCISEFQDEREVLILPGTMFNVVDIINENSSYSYIIHLENVLPKWELMALISAGRSGKLDDIDFEAITFVYPDTQTNV